MPRITQITPASRVGQAAQVMSESRPEVSSLIQTCRRTTVKLSTEFAAKAPSYITGHRKGEDCSQRLDASKKRLPGNIHRQWQPYVMNENRRGHERYLMSQTQNDGEIGPFIIFRDMGEVPFGNCVGPKKRAAGV